MKFKTAKGKTIEKRSLVYELEPAARETFSEQLAENLRRAISNGQFKAGEILPGLREMAKLCGTSVQVPIDALKTLTEEGLVKARPRIGCVVLGKNRKVWHGRILMIHVGAHSNYGQNVFCAEMASLLCAANWRVVHFHVPRRKTGYCNLEHLSKVIAEACDLVLLPAYDQPVLKIVRESGIPYMLQAAQVGEPKDVGCIGNMAFADMQAVSDFAAHCREVGIRHILNMRFDNYRHSGLDELQALGVKVEEMRIDVEMSDSRAERISSAAYCAMLERLGGKCDSRPDLVYFADDYLARGGLWAMERLGMRVPEDIKVVSLSNYGNAPFYPRQLTCFEYNHFDFAAKTVRAILRYLKTGTLPGNVLCNIRYVRGETF